MKICRGAVAILLLVGVLATSSVAEEARWAEDHAQAPVELGDRPRYIPRYSPRLAGTAMIVNTVYVPLRLALVAVGGVLGGFAGFITLGSLGAAESIWGLTDGSAVITPAMLEGTEEFHFSAYD
jgi:hypothetical protein